MTRSIGVVLAVALSVFAGACNGQPVGRKCFIPGLDTLNGGDAGIIPENILASPALECQSRTCLHLARQGMADGQGGTVANNNLCTAQCGGDGDCAKVPESPCKGGFVCAVAVETGPFCCKKFCQCK